MADEQAGGQSLALHLLCAVPQLQDPNFVRSVVLMLDHDARGALGLVLNNPVDTTMGEVARSLDLDWRGDEEQPIRVGGPVEPARGWILHDQPEWDPSAEDVMPGIKLTTSLEPVRASSDGVFGGDGSRFLFLLGYAGWGPGQLEAEIGAGSWVLVPFKGVTTDEETPGVLPDWVFETDTSRMWDAALRSIGVDPIRLVGLQGGSTLH